MKEFEEAVARLRKMARDYDKLAQDFEDGTIEVKGCQKARAEGLVKTYRHWANVAGVGAWLLSEEKD